MSHEEDATEEDKRESEAQKEEPEREEAQVEEDYKGQPVKKAPLTFEDLLVSPKQSSYSLRDLLNDRPKTPQKSQAAVAIRRPRNQPPKTSFQCELPQETSLMSPDKECWKLRCFCDVKMEKGFMVQCETCLTWQHSACVNMNQNTLPVNYQCPICSGKHIRCVCEDNMNYRHPLIRCSKCGYWVHRKCEHLDPGPYHSAGHVCTQCGGTNNSPPDVNLPYDAPFQNDFVELTQSVIDGMHPTILTAPFASVLTTEFLGETIGSLQLCEIFYNRYRPFFYLTHPQITHFYSRKKKRGDVSFSFFRAVFYVLGYLFGMPQDIAILIFDMLAKADIYLPYTMPTTLLQSVNTPVEFSDPAKDEFAKTKNIREVPQVSFPTIVMKNGGIYCTKEGLQVEQLIGIAGGFVGLVDEYSYDDGVDSQLYVCCGTKFVLDTRKGSPQFIHNFRRSLSPNCVVKLVKNNGYCYAGIFSGVSDVNGITRRTRREKFAIAGDTELLLPIDFAPATIEEPQEYMGWHFEELEVQQPETMSSPPSQKAPQRVAEQPPKHIRPSREEREEIMVIRQVDRTAKKGRRQKQEKEGKINKQIKRKPGKPPRGPKHHTEAIESSLFTLIRSQNPEPYLFGLPNQDDERYDDMERAREARKDNLISTADIDCSFIDRMLSVETPKVCALMLTDQMAEMQALVNLDGL